MSRFRIWAPQATSVELDLDGHSHAMTQVAGGWWQRDIASASPDALYAFRVDGSEPLPAPRSPWQPLGVHGPSRLLDHQAFVWTDGNWSQRPLASAVIYEAHIGTFTPEGTFEAAIERLDHLVEQGITHIEIMPVAAFPGTRGWGYDGVDLFAPHEAYGGPWGLKRLVDACHRRGLAVILDVVYNHLGPAGNYLSRFGPYFTSTHSTPWGPAVNLDGPGSHEVRRFFIDNALMWLRDYHIDGLRLDAVHALIDTSALHFLEELALEVAALEAHLGRPLVLIAESDLNDPRLVRSRDAYGYGLHAQWSDDFHHALHALLSGEQGGYYQDFGAMQHLGRALCDVYVYAGQYSPHRHRHHGRPAAGLPGTRFLGYLQNHDQIGNRARGERSSHVVSIGRLKIGAAMVLTAPFVPLLFQGEEWGASTPFLYFTDHEDPELGQAVSEGRRREFACFGWDPAEIPDPQDVATFSRSKLDWSEIDQPQHAEMLDWHRRLIALRRAMPELTDGRLELVAIRYQPADGWFVMRRGRIAVICNLADEPRRIPLEQAPREILLASRPPAMHLASQRAGQHAGPGAGDMAGLPSAGYYGHSHYSGDSGLVGPDIELPADSVAILLMEDS